jgi:hypothetical protein
MQYINIVIPIIAVSLSAWLTYYLTARHFRKQKWFEFDQRRLDEFYGPIFNLIKQVRANIETSAKISEVSDQAWREICESHPHPFEDHDKYFEPFNKALDNENERFNREYIPTLDKMLDIFKVNGHLAYQSTENLFSEFSQYVDQFHRPLPYEVWKKLNPSAEPLAKLSDDIEAHVDNLRRKLSGDKCS